MDFLPQQNKRNAGDDEARAAPGGTITAAGKHVIVIGGGDTGSDCIGTATRQGAASITQLEILPMPPEKENKALVWPDWPLKLRTSSSQQEGCERDWAVLTKDARATGQRPCRGVGMRPGRVGAGTRRAVGDAGDARHDLCAKGRSRCLPRWRWGFWGRAAPACSPNRPGSSLDPRGNVAATTRDYQTSVPRIFAAGDMRRGQSLVVWAIREGRQCARAVDEFLMGSSILPR